VFSNYDYWKSNIPGLFFLAPGHSQPAGFVMKCFHGHGTRPRNDMFLNLLKPEQQEQSLAAHAKFRNAENVRII
jgi:hypothetical protein